MFEFYNLEFLWLDAGHVRTCYDCCGSGGLPSCHHVHMFRSDYFRELKARSAAGGRSHVSLGWYPRGKTSNRNYEKKHDLYAGWTSKTFLPNQWCASLLADWCSLVILFNNQFIFHRTQNWSKTMPIAETRKLIEDISYYTWKRSTNSNQSGELILIWTWWICCSLWQPGREISNTIAQLIVWNNYV